MNRGDLAAAVAARIGAAQSQASGAIDAALDEIARAIGRGEEVRLVGFGVFFGKERPASQGRNPRTGEALEIPERRVVKFRAGAELKAAANGAKAA